MLLIYLFALVAAVSGAVQRCCAPSKYSAVMLQVGGSHKSGTSEAKIEDNIVEIQFDYDTNMMVVVSHSLNMTTGMRSTYTLRYDYAFSTNYITMPDGKCYKQVIDPKGLSDRCLPASLKSWGTAQVGAGMGAIPVRGWAGDVNDTYGITGRLEISVTDDGAQCVPVSMYQYGTTNGGRERVVNAFLYTDVVESIDSDMFNIPRNCANCVYCKRVEGNPDPSLVYDGGINYETLKKRWLAPIYGKKKTKIISGTSGLILTILGDNDTLDETIPGITNWNKAPLLRHVYCMTYNQ